MIFLSPRGANIVRRVIPARSQLRSISPFVQSAKMSGNIAVTRKRHRFAPLPDKQNAPKEDGIMKLKGIVFDMDGTLCTSVT